MKKEVSILKMINNDEIFYEFIRKLRNDPRVKSGFIQKKNVTKKQQQAYMEKYKNNYHICTIAGRPAGYIGVIDGDIRIATHPSMQGKGVGKFMVKFVMKKYKNIQAKVMFDNEPSMKLFKSSGFKLKYYILEP